MPVYTYRCDNCGVQFDRHQHFDEPVLVRCPECEHDSLRKLFLPVWIVFRGSGFYATDHRSPSGHGSSKKPDKPEASAGGAAPEAKPPSGEAKAD